MEAYHWNESGATEMETDYMLFPHELHRGNFEWISDAFTVV